MVQPVYDSTSGIDIKISPIHQAGEERGKVGGPAELFYELCQHIIERVI